MRKRMLKLLLGCAMLAGFSLNAMADYNPANYTQDYYHVLSGNTRIYYKLDLVNKKAELTKITDPNRTIDLLQITKSCLYNGNNYEINSIGDNAFQELTSIGTIQFLGPIEHIGSTVFTGKHADGDDQSFLKFMYLSGDKPNKLIIDDNAFAGAQNLTIVVDNNSPDNIEIGKSAFENVKNVNLNKFMQSVTKLDDSAFKNAQNVAISKTIYNTTEENSFVVSPTYTPNLNYVGAHAFESSSITDFSMPVGCQLSPDGYQLNDCHNIQTIRFDNMVPEANGWSVIPTHFASNSTVEYALLNPAYKYDIKESAFEDCDTLAAFNINTSSYTDPVIYAIAGRKAFKNCFMLSIAGTHAPYGKNVEMIFQAIDDSAFENCYYLDKIRMVSEVDIDPNMQAYVGQQAFKKCFRLATADVTDTRSHNLANFVFYECSNLEFVYLRDIHTIGDGSFYSCGGQLNDGSVINCVYPIVYFGTDAFRDAKVNMFVENTQHPDFKTVSTNANFINYWATGVFANPYANPMSAMGESGRVYLIDETGLNVDMVEAAKVADDLLYSGYAKIDAGYIADNAFYHYKLGHPAIEIMSAKVGANAFSNATIEKLILHPEIKTTFATNAFASCQPWSILVRNKTTMDQWATNFTFANAAANPLNMGEDLGLISNALTHVPSAWENFTVNLPVIPSYSFAGLRADPTLAIGAGVKNIGSQAFTGVNTGNADSHLLNASAALTPPQASADAFDEDVNWNVKVVSLEQYNAYKKNSVWGKPHFIYDFDALGESVPKLKDFIMTINGEESAQNVYYVGQTLTFGYGYYSATVNGINVYYDPMDIDGGFVDPGLEFGYNIEFTGGAQAFEIIDDHTVKIVGKGDNVEGSALSSASIKVTYYLKDGVYDDARYNLYNIGIAEVTPVEELEELLALTGLGYPFEGRPCRETLRDVIDHYDEAFSNNNAEDILRLQEEIDRAVYEYYTCERVEMPCIDTDYFVVFKMADGNSYYMTLDENVQLGSGYNMKFINTKTDINDIYDQCTLHVNSMDGLSWNFSREIDGQRYYLNFYDGGFGVSEENMDLVSASLSLNTIIYQPYYLRFKDTDILGCFCIKNMNPDPDYLMFWTPKYLDYPTSPYYSEYASSVIQLIPADNRNKNPYLRSMPGDMNGDGVLSVNDVNLLVKEILQVKTNEENK